jgi:hypothetical protein
MEDFRSFCQCPDTSFKLHLGIIIQINRSMVLYKPELRASFWADNPGSWFQPMVCLGEGLLKVHSLWPDTCIAYLAPGLPHVHCFVSINFFTGVPQAILLIMHSYPELWILRYPAHRYHAVPSPGYEPTTLYLRVRQPNHSATMLCSCTLGWGSISLWMDFSV